MALLRLRKWLLRTRLLEGQGWIHKPFYEKRVRSKLRAIKGDVFWDIGANIGFYSLMAQRNFKRIVAVEPNPETAATLKRRTQKAANIEVLEVALSSTSGPSLLYTRKEKFNIPGFNNKNGSDSLLQRVDYKSARDPSNDRVVQNRPSIQVLQRRFDELSTGPVDIVKVDVEGAEFLVLDGMRSSLKNGLVKRILVELHNREEKSKLESLITGYGYSLEWLDPDHLFATLQ